jgi:hypothetical protein
VQVRAFLSRPLAHRLSVPNFHCESALVCKRATASIRLAALGPTERYIAAHAPRDVPDAEPPELRLRSNELTKSPAREARHASGFAVPKLRKARTGHAPVELQRMALRAGVEHALAGAYSISEVNAERSLRFI